MGNKLKIKEMAESWFQSEKKIKIIVAIGLIGILLIFASSWFDFGKKDTDVQTQTDFDTEQYIARLEDKIHTMVSGIQGVGKAKVMVTLESSTEYVYESEKKEQNDTAKDYAEGQTKKEQEKNNYERNIILVEGTGGKREALLKTTIEPKVKGVVIVCQGGENIEVEKSITDAVTTALDISSNKVCVVKLSAE